MQKKRKFKLIFKSQPYFISWSEKLLREHKFKDGEKLVIGALLINKQRFQRPMQKKQ